MLSFLCRFTFLGKLSLNNIKLNPILNRIVVECSGPPLATLKAVMVSGDAVSVFSSPRLSSARFSSPIAAEEEADLNAEYKVLYSKAAAVCCNVELSSVNILKIGEISAISLR